MCANVLNEHEVLAGRGQHLAQIRRKKKRKNDKKLNTQGDGQIVGPAIDTVGHACGDQQRGCRCHARWGCCASGYQPHFDAIGDSITRGDPIRFALGADGSVVPSELEYQGWPEVLGASLAGDLAAGHPVHNLGEPGAKVETLANKYRRAWFNTDERADVLLLIGTNDSNPSISTPSGYQCVDEACEGTYLAEFERLVRNLLSQGRKTVYVASLPPIWGTTKREIFNDPLSESATRNRLVAEYNRVLSEKILSIPGVRPGPDFFSCFLTPEVNRFSLFRDALHPNTLGQVVMAAVWRSFLAGTQDDPCRIPIYIVESLDSHRYGHKQNMLSRGDRYYVDEEHVLENIPDELAAGIWITPANAYRNKSDYDYLVFDAGRNPVTVYIAFDAAGGPPISTSHRFAPVALSSRLEVSDNTVVTFEVVMANDVVGRVQIGGPDSSRGEVRQQSYLVIVVP